MKLKNTLALGFGLTIALSAQVYAQETLSNPINEDLFFSNGVQLQGVSESAVGVATITLEGTGSITVGSQSSGGFPRVAISAGSSITSTRAWASEDVPKTSWSGQLVAPSSGRLPVGSELTFSYATSLGNEFEAVDAFVWGLTNETFSFGNPARFVFPVDEQDGQRLWYAAGNGTSWSVASKDDYCVVESGLCYLELNSINGIALVKQVYETCPTTSVINGTIGSAPNCIVTCDQGYLVDSDGNECLADAFADEGAGDGGDGGEDEASLSLEDLSPEQQEDLQAFAQDYGVNPLEILAAIPGNVRLRESSVAWQRYLPEYSDLTAEELELVRNANRGYLSRNPRSAEEQLASADQVDPEEERLRESSFMNYLLQMRNNFAKRDEGGAGDGAEVAEGELSEGEEDGESVAASDEFKSSGGKLLPSTGPGLFITIAIIGFLLMLFGGIRRN